MYSEAPPSEPAVALVHRDDVWAKGLSSLLLALRMRMRGHWTSPNHALDVTDRLGIDLLILSWELADAHSVARLRQLPKPPAIILVLEPTDEIALGDLIGLPIKAVLRSDSSVEDTEKCLKIVAGGGRCLEGAELASSQKEITDSGWARLSDRELEVAALAIEGFSNKHIGKYLGVSDGTVKVHMHHILAKLNLSRREDLRLMHLPCKEVLRRLSHLLTPGRSNAVNEEAAAQEAMSRREVSPAGCASCQSPAKRLHAR